MLWRRVFPQQFRVLPKFHECYHIKLYGNTENVFYSLSTKQFAMYHRVMVNGFEPIRARVVSCLFYKEISSRLLLLLLYLSPPLAGDYTDLSDEIAHLFVWIKIN